MRQMRGRDEVKGVIIAEYLRGDVSLRELAARYGIGHSTISRWVRAGGRETAAVVGGSSSSSSSSSNDEDRREEEDEDLAAEVKRLRKELRDAELHNKFLNAMIDIAEEQFEIPIRKKSGPKQ
jgi:transposase-like protein